MPELFDFSTVLAVLRDGRILAKATREIGTVSAGTVAFTVRIPDLKQVEYVLDVQFTTDPVVDIGHEVNIHTEGNVVGMTLTSVAAGTTLTAHVLGIGPP